MGSEIRYPGAMPSPGGTTRPAACPPQAGRVLSAQVDLGRLRQNLAILRRSADGRGILAVVKADAYGHGAAPVARTLAAAGVDGFCVATLAEGLELRQEGVSAPILVFGSSRPEALPMASAHGLELTVVSAAHLQELQRLVPQYPVGLHLKFDTGMGRCGIQVEEVGPCLDPIRALQPWIRGAMAHFASADEADPGFAWTQRSRFTEVVAQLRDAGVSLPMLHHGNSAACLRGLLEGDTHVRCGIALYGTVDLEEGRAAGLRPILELRAEVMRSVVIAAGTPVGYGSTFVAAQPVRLATLACGYADGYPRALGSRARAGFCGATYPVVGQVSMDSLTVALPTAVAIHPGDAMTLLSSEPEDPHSVVNLARLLGTIPYELTCGLHRRVVREYP